MPAPSTVREFGSYRLDGAERLLLRSGQPIALTPKAFDLLVHLVEHAGHLVTKHELMDVLWPDTAVEEANLAYTVSALRKALEDGKHGVHFIQTVPTRGYRFVAEVTAADGDGATRPPPHAAAEPSLSGLPDAQRVTPGARRRRVPWTFAVIALVALVAAAARQYRQPSQQARATRLTITLPDATLATHAIPVPQVAPDGRRVALLVNAGSAISLRNMDDGNVTTLAGTSGARSLFWAPDSAHLAFTTPLAVKTLRLSDGAIETLCDTCGPAGGGTWSTAGLIVVAGQSGSLFSVPSRGGAVEQVTTLDASAGETAHRAPHFLPDGQHFLYSIRSREISRNGLYVGQLGSSQRRLLIQGDTQAVFAEPGYVAFLQAGVLMARPFDVAALEFTGDASPIVRADSLRNEVGGQPAFSAAETGVLTYAIVERPPTQFQWVGRDGRPLELVGHPGIHYTFDLSPDARRLVYARRQPGGADLHVLDIDRGIATAVTSGGGSYADPRWADGGAVVATRWLPLPQAVVKITPGGMEQPLTSTPLVTMLEAVSHDGKRMLYRQLPGGLFAMPLAGGAEPELVRRAPGNLNQSRFSPDMRWVAYHEAPTEGGPDVYVARFPPTGERWQVSSHGGVQPMWRHDSRELYYLGRDGAMNAVTLRSGRRPAFSAAARLFSTGLVAPAANIEEYAVSGDGRRFLLLRPVEDRVRSSIGVIQNWPAMLPASSGR